MDAQLAKSLTLSGTFAISEHPVSPGEVWRDSFSIPVDEREIVGHGDCRWEYHGIADTYWGPHHAMSTQVKMNVKMSDPALNDDMSVNIVVGKEMKSFYDTKTFRSVLTGGHFDIEWTMTNTTGIGNTMSAVGTFTIEPR